MTSVIQEALDGAVAAGTLALASFTYYLGAATKRLGTETRNARLDALAPRVIVQNFRVLPNPVTRATIGGQSPNKIDPGSFWDMTKSGNHHVGIVAKGELINEGDGTAEFAFLLCDGIEMEDPVKEISDSSARPFRRNVPLGQGYFSIPPGKSVFFTLVAWKPAHEWGDLFTRYGETCPLDAVGPSTITITNRFFAVQDIYKLRFARFPLIRQLLKDGWKFAYDDPRINFGEATISTAIVSPVNRHYS